MLPRCVARFVCATSTRSLQRGRMAAKAQEAAASDVLLFTEWGHKDRYRQLMEARGMKVVYPEDVQDWECVGFAVAWLPPVGLLAKCPNLKAAMSLGAGVDHILQPGQVPDSVPILRVVDERMAERMATWVIWGVISWQRRFENYARAQRERRWDLDIERRANLDSADVRVGVLGFGTMGRATAEALAGLGYQVSAWTRRPRTHERIRCYHGRQSLREFVSQADVLICLLPLTPDTTGIINAQLLSWLPKGSAVINGGRGGHLVEPDLLAALDDGQVAFALLDVFAVEPLPADSPLWTHPRVRLTPHVASFTTIENAADQIAANYSSLMTGKGPLPQNVVDRAAGY